MAEYFYFDEKFVEKQKATIPVMTHAFLYGTSVFEGIRAYYNEEDSQLYAFRVREHFERLFKSAKYLYMDTLHTIDEYIEITRALLKKNNFRQDVYLRPVLYKAGESIGPRIKSLPDKFLMIAVPMGDYIDVSKGLRVCVSNWRRNSDNAIPPKAKISGAYVNTSLISTDSRVAGFDDAIVLSEEGYVTEGSAMNLFIIRDKKLITPPITDNILEGITRSTVIQLAKEVLNLEVEERRVLRSELYIAQEAFYSGTGAQLSPIVNIDNRDLGNGKVGETFSELQKLYMDVVKGKIPKYKDWCLSVYD